ncbi:MAG: hypothetical protein M3Y86_12135 [Verrucomicrobiota bacterium]|nr:hypothetical protein [Verrucomicrobiota bacterium]
MTRRFPIALGTVALFALAVNARAVDSEPTTSADWLFGKWKGVSLSGEVPHGHQVAGFVADLDLRPGDEPGTIAGTWKTYRLEPKGTVYRASDVTVTEVHGQYDDLTQSACIFDDRRHAVRFVLDAKTHTRAGVPDGGAEIVGSGAKPYQPAPHVYRNLRLSDEPFPFSVLYREEKADAFLDDLLARFAAAAALGPTRRAPPPRRRGNVLATPEPSPEMAAGAWQPPSPEKLLEWISPLNTREDLVTRTNPLTADYQRVHFRSNLFEDGYFSSFFGKPYDQLSAADLRAVYLQFRAPRPPTGSPPVAQLPLASQYPHTAELFDGPDLGVLLGVQWRRAIAHWLNATEQRLKNMPVNLDAFPQLEFAEATATAELATLWPDERTKLPELIVQTRTRVAEPVVTLRTDDLIARANAEEDLEKLISWPDDEKELLAYLPPEKIARLQEKIDTRAHELAGQLLMRKVDSLVANSADSDGLRRLINWEKEVPGDVIKYASSDDKSHGQQRAMQRADEMLTSAIAKDERAAPITGTSMAAVTAGTNWFEQLNKNYGFADERPPFKEAVQRLASRRGADLAGAEQAIIEEVNKQSSAQAVEHVITNFLAVPGDAQTDPGKAIVQAGGVRNKAIEREQMLAMFSPHERQMLNPNGVIAIPAKIPEPDEDDLRIAIVRTLEMMGGTRAGPFKVNWTNPITQRLGIYPIITVERVEKLQASPVAGGYLVSYRPHISIGYPESFNRYMNSQPSFGATMLQGLVRQFNGPQGTKEGRFELSERGWWCPSMRDERADDLDD